LSAEKPHRGALPNTDTDTSRASVARDFEQIPRILARLVTRADLSFYEFGLLAFIASSINYRTCDFTTTLLGLLEASDWQHKDEHLRRTLLSLKNKGWIDYEVRPGPRAPYVIRLGENYHRALAEGSDFDLSLPNLLSDGPPPEEIIPSESQTDVSVNADGNGDRTTPNLHQAASPYTDTNTDTPTQSGEGSKTTPLGGTAFGPKTLSVLEELEKARAAQERRDR
jgi:hypothetical protein